MRLFELTFEWSLCCWLLYASLAMLCILLHMKWPWCMILLWIQLRMLLECLDMNWVDFCLLPWPFSFIFDPRLVLVVFWAYVEFICFRLSTNALRIIQMCFSLIVKCANLCFVGDSYAWVFVPCTIGPSVWLLGYFLLVVTVDLFTNEFDLFRYFSCLSSLNLLALLFSICFEV